MYCILFIMYKYKPRTNCKYELCTDYKYKLCTNYKYKLRNNHKYYDLAWPKISSDHVFLEMTKRQQEVT